MLTIAPRLLDQHNVHQPVYEVTRHNTIIMTILKLYWLNSNEAPIQLRRLT